MPDTVPRPPPLELSADGWKRFEFDWKNYLVAAELTKKSSAVKVAILLSVCGPEAQDRFKSFTWNEDNDACDIDKVMKKFEECTPVENTTVERFKFNSRQQKPGEPIKEYVAELRRLAVTCKFENISSDDIVNQLIWDKIVVGLPDATLRTRLLEEGSEITLNKAIQMIACSEQVRLQCTVLDSKDSTYPVAGVPAVKQSDFEKKKKYKRSDEGNCLYCGGMKDAKLVCPAKNRRCHKCKKLGHYGKVCRSKFSESSKEVKQKISSTRVLAINGIDRKSAVTCMYKIRGTEINFLVDCGAEVNVMPVALYIQLTGDKHLQKVDRSNCSSLQAFGGNDVHTKGTVKLNLEDASGSHQAVFHVTEADDDPILGLSSSVSLGLVSFGNKVDVRQSSHLVSSLVPLMQTCPSSKEEVYQCYKDVFSDDKVGDFNVYHHVKVDTNVHPVIHAQRRVPEPIRPAVKAKLDELVAKKVIETVSEATDWVRSLVVVPKKDGNFRALMEHCRRKKIKVNRDKLQYKVPEVSYMGHRLTPQGMEPDPNKISGIVNMPAPGDLTHLRGFLCTVNFLARYLPKLATVSEPLRQLLKKNVPYVWSDAHEKSFNVVKELVTCAPILRYYDPRIDVVLQCDASQYGLGAALIQDGKPVAYASRAMTSTEKNYAQIEKELLAIVFATQRFDQYIYGLSAVEVHTDHKPLEAILRKSINDSANRRIQRMLLRLQRYNLCVKYVPGRELWIADTLSRQLPCPRVKPGAFAIKLAEHELAIDLAVTAECLQEYRTTSSQDSELQAVVVAIRSGDWSMPAVAEYTPVKSELSTDGVLVFKGARLVVPRTLRSRVFQQLHAVHMGIEATRRRARESVFWPGLNGHIKDMVSRCSTCAAVQPSQAREPMLSHEVPVVPWTKVGMDFFEWNRQKYLVITDYTSNWFEAKKFKSTSASSLVRECRVQFARHGVPLQIVAYSGTQFLSRTFHKFAEEWNFEVVTSSPYHHQSNGKAENAVHTIKKLLSKSEMSNTDPLLAILEWRNTPSEATGTSPTQKLFGRRCRTPLPVSTGLLMPVSS
ncbi:hypothetical protein Pcinc_013114 [Petrolisthes cinctipes]|uniref:RNA-directed DNA polymerase n=1 Tax=Petrolisthes cinctipes TaxID=88211 RepID=A0AAE1FZJ2_PETCI|nr:hypothetical protein Pcinc_013114 [Petrolisthes cinctipes]